MLSIKVDFAKKKIPGDKFYTFHTSALPTPIREAVQALPHGTKVFLRTDINEMIVGHTTRGDVNGNMKDVYLETLLPRTDYLYLKSVRFAIGDIELFATV